MKDWAQMRMQLKPVGAGVGDGDQDRKNKKPESSLRKCQGSSCSWFWFHFLRQARQTWLCFEGGNRQQTGTGKRRGATFHTRWVGLGVKMSAK